MYQCALTTRTARGARHGLAEGPPGRGVPVHLQGVHRVPVPKERRRHQVALHDTTPSQQTLRLLLTLPEQALACDRARSAPPAFVDIAFCPAWPFADRGGPLPVVDACRFSPASPRSRRPEPSLPVVPSSRSSRRSAGVIATVIAVRSLASGRRSGQEDPGRTRPARHRHRELRRIVRPAGAAHRSRGPRALVEAGGLIQLLDTAGRTERAEMYSALGLTLRYEKTAATGQERVHARLQLKRSGGRI